MRHWRNVVRTIAAGMMISAALAAPLRAQDARRRKKLIATGWDRVNSERLLANHVAMQKRPFDGVVVAIEGHVDEKKRCPLWWAHLETPWKRSWFTPCVRNLRACKFTRFTDNFVQIGANPGRVDWFDEAGFREIVDHWRIAAWVAKAGGFKGLVFDPEPYARPHAQFHYAAQEGREKHTFDEYRVQARRRGREVMRAIVAEFPDVTILCYFMNSVVARAAGRPRPGVALEPMSYGLLPAFFDGWLDEAPPGVTLVDGCESAYRYNATTQYLEAAVTIKGVCQELVSPANRAKYRAQVQVGYGVYLDAYWNPKDSEWSAWYVDGLGAPRVDRLRINTATALRVADEYIWIYGEKFRWWPTPSKRVRPQPWPEALVGCERALAYARDPLAAARAQIAARAKAGPDAPLLRNGDFGSEKLRLPDGRVQTFRDGRPPVGWSGWQAKDSKGTFAWDRRTGAAGAGSARASGVANGCFLQHHPARAGERYAVRAVRKLRGAGRAWLRVRWQTADGAWTAEQLDRVFHADAPAGAWGEIFGVVEVPESAGQIVLLLGVGDQAGEKDIAWFDDVTLWRLN